MIAFSTQALAQAGETAPIDSPSNAGPVAAVALLMVMALLLGTILTSNRLKGSSLFNRLFIVVAVTSGFFSALSSAIGFSLITSQESYDLLRNDILPSAFGVFVFFLAVAIWVGGAEFVRHRDWFRGLGSGFISDMLFFVERVIKMFVVIPILGVVLFFVSTWTTVVGIGGADAVRHTYTYEINRLQAECSGITSYRQRDFLFLEDLRLSVSDVTRVARNERLGGAQSGAAGAGAVTDYFVNIAEWYSALGASVEAIIKAPDPSGVDPYDPEICANTVNDLTRLISRNAHDNYDRWAREFETPYNDFASVLNRWRHDRRIERLLDQQLASFDRANPKPVASRLTAGQQVAIDLYADDIKSALKSLIRKQKLAKPPVPIKSAAEVSPARGMEIINEIFSSPEPETEPERKSRTQAIVAAEFVPSLSTISPRDAVLKNANIFSDIWALAISWDYAAYILMFAFLFFPSAERAAGYKD
ncbi:MAG: hypothetical protein GXP06_07955 [Alphaproteobacteria bacterium]|nr:hypothetical protein [Alphaproteobacteria bacterium]